MTRSLLEAVLAAAAVSLASPIAAEDGEGLRDEIEAAYDYDPLALSALE